jgi:hypothetical protein
MSCLAQWYNATLRQLMENAQQHKDSNQKGRIVPGPPSQTCFLWDVLECTCVTGEFVPSFALALPFLVILKLYNNKGRSSTGVFGGQYASLYVTNEPINQNESNHTKMDFFLLSTPNFKTLVIHQTSRKMMPRLLRQDSDSRTTHNRRRFLNLLFCGVRAVEENNENFRVAL